MAAKRIHFRTCEYNFKVRLEGDTITVMEENRRNAIEVRVTPHLFKSPFFFDMIAQAVAVRISEIIGDQLV